MSDSRRNPATAADLPDFQASSLLLPAVLLVVAAALLTIDLPVARFALADDYPKLVSDILDNAEPFGHAAGVGFLVIAIAALEPRSRLWICSLCAGSALAGGMLANLVKLSVGRIRPRNSDLLMTHVADTFQGWLPLGTGGSAAQSFPSAHTATAMGFAVALSAVYPRGRWWFMAMAALVGLHRIDTSAHFPSDVVCGAIVGWIAGQLCIASTKRIHGRPATVASASDRDGETDRPRLAA